MSILCGTDFSPHAGHAGAVAAALAARLGESLELVHVAAADGAPHADARGRLEAEAVRLRSGGVAVNAELLDGTPGEALAGHAKKTGARMIVVASLGSSGEHIVTLSPAPVLVTRGGEGLLAWARDGRGLRVVVGVDFSAPADAAVRWAGELRRRLPCDLVLAHVCWSPAEHRRLHIDGPLDLAATHPEVAKSLARDLAARFGKIPGAGDARIRVRAGLGRPADHLVELAGEEKADLLIVGTHQRTGLGKLWHGSVSCDVLQLAPMAVACVPTARAERSAADPIPDLRQALVPTDLSELGNRAIAYAYALVPRGGIVHLLHVPATPALESDPEARLREQIPRDASDRGIRTVVHIVSATDVVEAIAQEAERIGVDVICMGSHGRSGIAKALLGSVAQGLLQVSGRPVLVVTARPE